MSDKSRWRGAQQHYEEQEWAIEKLDPGWAKASLFFRSGCVHHFGHAEEEYRCRSLLEIAEALAGIRRRYEAGNVIEILHAVQLCAIENLPLPTWLAVAFADRFGSHLRPGGPPTLDQTFPDTSTVTPASKPEKARRDWGIGHAIWVHMRKSASRHTSFNPALKEAIAELDPGVSLTRARELVNEIEQVYIDKDPEYTPLSHFWPKRRKKDE